MCVAILVPAGVRLSDTSLISCFNNNPDGGGCAFVADGVVQIEKGWMEADTALIRYDDLHKQYGEDSAMLVHFRIATSGVVSKDNCHPFRIKGGAMIHNGHLWSTGYEAPKSDTREFAEIFYNVLDYASLCEAIDKHEFQEIIGGDKMAFLYDDGSWALAGQWQEDEGVWYSNRSYVCWDTGGLNDDSDHYWRFGV